MRALPSWALVFIAILYTTAPAVSAMARLNLMDTVNPEVGKNLAYDQRPDWIKNWEKTGLLAFDDKNGDGNIQYTPDSTTNELKVDRDIMVLANPEIAKLPNWVIALVAAGGLAAALSTAAGLLLAISSAISHDLIKGVINPNISEKKELLTSRISMAAAIAVAAIINPPGSQWHRCVSLWARCFLYFPSADDGIFGKNINKEGAIAGMIAGTVTLFYVFQHKEILFIAD